MAARCSKDVAQSALFTGVIELVDGDGNWTPSCVVKVQGRQTERRVKNRILGRALSRSGPWRRLWQ